MPPVDLNKNKDSIVKAHKEVSDPSSKTNWTLFGYDGQTDVLKLVSKGDGGIEELLEDLSGGKILYAYIKVIDPNSNLPKFVFVNWQGEGVPEVRKGACANHVRDVQNLLRGAHVSINARTEDDVDEKVILSKVSKSSGSNYSFHKEEKKPMPAVEPVGSVYQKVRPQIEIKPDVKQSFWEASERDEKQRILLEKQQAAKERAKLENEIKEREIKEAKAREQRENDRVKKIQEVQEAQKRADAHSSASKADYNAADAVRDEEERAKRSEEMRKNRAAEAKALVSGRANEARSKFEQKPTSQFDQPVKEQAPARKLKHAFIEGSDQPPPEPSGRKQPIQLPKGDAQSHPEVEVVAQPRPPAPPKAVEREPEIVQHEESAYDDNSSAPDTVTTPPSAGPQIKNLLAQGLPQRQPDSDEEQEEDQNWDEPSNFDQSPQPTAHVVARPEPEAEIYNDVAVTADQEEDLYQDTEVAGSRGVCARALYDYQAAEENEISFDPDDIITNIEMIDEGWWLGTSPDGNHGMFPSNFVELF